MKKLFKKSLALLLALVMCLGMLQLSAFAEELKCPNCGGTNIVAKGEGYVCNDCDDYVIPIEVKDEETKPNTYTLTVKYEFPGGKEILPEHTEQLMAGDEYCVESPAYFGYTPEKDTVTGKIFEGDTKETVKYEPTPYTWTINYVDEAGNVLKGSYVQKYTILTVGDLTAPAIPEVPGYTVKSESVTVPDPKVLGDVEGKVVYEPIIYTLTIKYEFPGGEEVFSAVELNLPAGSEYSVESPYLLGYAPEKDTVTGTMPVGGDVITVKYEPAPYTWTIKYVDEAGNDLQDSVVKGYTVDTVKSLTAPANPEVLGYKIKSESVTAPDPQELGNVVSEVVYEPITYTWTIKYVDEAGNVLEDGTVKEYTILTVEDLTAPANPEVPGYKVKFESESVTMPDPQKLGNVVSEVVYEPITYTLTIKYEDLNGEEISDLVQYTGEFKFGQEYSVKSPDLPGYTPEFDVVTGTMPAGDTKWTVKYSPIQNPTPDTGDNTPTVPSTTTYSLTINYVDEDGNVVASAHSERLASGSSYRVTSPVIDGYTAGQSVVSGIIRGNTAVTVVYTADVEVPEEEAPLVPEPEEDPVEEPEDPVEPAEESEEVEEFEVEDPDVPLASAPEELEEAEELEEFEIEDPDVPLANVPKTGDSTGPWYIMAMLSAFGLAVLGFLKKRDDQKN